MQGTRWIIVVSILCLCLLASGVGEVASLFTDSETSNGNGFHAWISNLWVQTARSDFEAGIPDRTDTRSSPGDVGLARDNGIFAFQGGTTAFWKYGVPANSWASLTAAPGSVGTGGALAYDGARYIYALCGGNGRIFGRYDTIGGPWETLANTPANVGAGGALACDGAGHLYALRGANTRTFWRYDTTANTWAAMANTPAAVTAGGALAYDGARYLYAFRGNNLAAFWRYDTMLNSWVPLGDAPGRVNAGGSLAYDGGDYIYAFRGANQRAFWRYSISGGSWTPMADTPARVNAGGSLAYAGQGYVYAFRGNVTAAFWRYDVLANIWTVMAAAPGNVNAGGALAFVPAPVYVNSATIASQVLNTGSPGDRWDALIWDETLAASTDITFEVRASDTLFTANADNATLAWVPVGGTSPLAASLPAGQYKQWRATLTTADAAVTPLLSEVRLYHY